MEVRDRSSISGYYFSSWLTILADTLFDIKGFIDADATEVGLGIDAKRIGVHRCGRKTMLPTSFIQTEGCLPLPTWLFLGFGVVDV